jgi:subtilisin-like proprotein convertase family protein
MAMTQRIRLLVIAGLLVGLGSPVSALTFSCLGDGGSDCTSLIPDAGGDMPAPEDGHDVPGMLVSALTVPGGTCGATPIGRVDVGIDLIHDWIGDLRLELTDPSGNTVRLLNRPGTGVGGSPGDDVRATFGDGFPLLSIADGIIPAISGLQVPAQPLAALNGDLADGAWSLVVTDFDNSGTGALEDWTLYLVCGTVPEVTIEASDPIAAESPVDIGTFTVTRSVVTSESLTVNVIFGGTAGPGDYLPLVVPVVIPAGQASVPLTVTPVPDATYEGVETVVATVTAGVGYEVGDPSSATVLIYDVLPPPGIPTLSGLGLALLLALIALAGLWRLRARPE